MLHFFQLLQGFTMPQFRTRACLAALMIAVAAPASVAFAQTPAPALPAPALPAPALARALPAIPAPVAEPYPGVIRLEVDATDIDRQIMTVRETVPVTPGPLTLLYPKFLPGNHAATGPVNTLAGLTITANGQRLEWIRDTVEAWAFHVEVPQGVSEIVLDFQWITPQGDASGRRVMTPSMLNLQWEKALLYPAGHVSTGITVAPSVKLPEGWQYGVALDTASFDAGVATFAPTDLYTLIDSPMFAGINYRRFDLDPGGQSPVWADVVADTPAMLEKSDDKVALMRALVDQADLLFGSRHFDRYQLLVAVTEELGDIGLEHHRSSENQVATGYFTGIGTVPYGDLAVIPHEYMHSWNGKYRRPIDSLPPHYNVPTQNSLLWVYEGQTQFWGDVMTARAGFVDKEQALSNFAVIAANLSTQAGRTWRSLQDTTNSALMGPRTGGAYASWSRGSEYYRESSLMIWLDADTLIREETNGRKSLDDFARAFFGPGDGEWAPKPYTFEELVATLNAVHPHDWTTFLRARLDNVDPAADHLLEGITRGGYRLAYVDSLTEAEKKVQSDWATNFQYSLGFSLTGTDNSITGVRWGERAFEQRIGAGWKLIAVNDVAATAEILRTAITTAKGGTEPIRLLIRNGSRFRTVAFDYHDGLRYPRLERVAGTPDRLGDILAPRRR